MYINSIHGTIVLETDSDIFVKNIFKSVKKRI